MARDDEVIASVKFVALVVVALTIFRCDQPIAAVVCARKFAVRHRCYLSGLSLELAARAVLLARVTLVAGIAERAQVGSRVSATVSHGNNVVDVGCRRAAEAAIGSSRST